MNCHRHLIDIIADTFHPFMVRMHKNAPFHISLTITSPMAQVQKPTRC